MRSNLVLWLLFGLVCLRANAAEQNAPAPKGATNSRAVLSVEQVVQMLDETIDWYRTLGAQQQSATQPSDLLILYANRRIADKVVGLAFEIARANAELLSSDEDVALQTNADAQSLLTLLRQLGEQRQSLRADIETVRRKLSAASSGQKAELQARLEVLQSELDMVQARRNLLATMSQFSRETDATGSSANALKAHIDAIAASIPSANNDPAAPAATTPGAMPSLLSTSAAEAPLSQFGIWDLTATALQLAAEMRTIASIERRTTELQELFTNLRTPPMQQLQTLMTRGDALAAQADTANTATLKGVRNQFDTLAWLFKQTASILAPLSKQEVLLTQYQRNLRSWSDNTQRQYHEALRALALRLAIFAGLLVLVFGAAQLWQRAVFRYVRDTRRRSRLLLLRKIVLWVLVVAIVASTFTTELGSLATFAGLITAGLAVAMQSVLVSVVGYFFLIGKYGIRIGDRVQIGSVTGEVIELGLVRLHLMELGGQGLQTPTGRVVAFANSIIFQASGGLFKQIPGVNLAWHEITLTLPANADYAAIKDELVATVTSVIADYHDEIARQTQAIQRAASSNTTGDPQPQVQLRFSAASVDAVVRYPVQLTHAAEIDERVSRELLNVITTHASSVPRLT